jgi:hypothetical protein
MGDAKVNCMTTVQEFYFIMSAVISANFLTIMFVYCLHQASTAEKAGRPIKIRHYAGLVFFPFMALVGMRYMF